MSLQVGENWKFSNSDEIRKIGVYTIVRKFVGFVDFVRPIIDRGSDKYISACVSNDEGVACHVVSFNNDIEKFVKYVQPVKILHARNLIAIPAIGILSVFHGQVEMMPFDLVLGKDGIVEEYYEATIE